jgi:hypothetical protein
MVRINRKPVFFCSIDDLNVDSFHSKTYAEIKSLLSLSTKNMRIRLQEGNLILSLKRRLIILLYLVILSFTAYFILYSLADQFSFGCRDNRIKTGRTIDRSSFVGKLAHNNGHKILKLQIENSGCSG